MLVVIFDRHSTIPRIGGSKQLRDFVGKKVADSGNTRCIFYACYFFEKLRIMGRKKVRGAFKDGRDLRCRGWNEDYRVIYKGNI